MNRKNRFNGIAAIVSFVLFIIFTVLVKLVDVKAIGPDNSSVGFAEFNKMVNMVFPYNTFYYEVSELLGYAAIGICLGFGLFGLVQLFKRKSLKKVDREIFILAGFYVVVIGFYVLFEIITINYRPVILDEGLEGSYPSSHTMLALCVYLSSVFMFEIYLAKKAILKNIAEAVCIFAGVITVISRAFSGVHWITDIIGSVLLSAALINAFIVCLLFEKRK